MLFAAMSKNLFENSTNGAGHFSVSFGVFSNRHFPGHLNSDRKPIQHQDQTSVRMQDYMVFFRFLNRVILGNQTTTNSLYIDLSGTNFIFIFSHGDMGFSN